MTAAAPAVGAASSGTSRPLASQASAARIPGPPPLVTIATRRPLYRRVELNTVAMSSISSIDPARTTPAWRSKASTPTSPPDKAAVCDAAPRRPATVRPALTATIGTRRPTRRATGTNDAGSGIDSRYSKITSTPDSSSQYRRRSLVDTSTAFPIDTKAPMPRPRACAASRTASPTAPDWLNRNAPTRSRQRSAEGGVETAVADAAEDPGAVGSHQPHAPFAGGCHEARLVCALAGLPRTRPISTYCRNAEIAGLGHHVADRIGRHADDDEIGRDRAGGEIRKRRDAAHLRVVRVDG